MGYINPLLDMPAGRALQSLPLETRQVLEHALRKLRAEANAAAEELWTSGSARCSQPLNPLFGLSAGKSLLDLPQATRRPLQILCRGLRAAALAESNIAWSRRKGPMALYFRLIAKYAHITERALALGSPGRAGDRKAAGSRSHLAVFYRALSTYSRHAAHAVSTDPAKTTAVKSTTNRPRLPPIAAARIV